MNAHAHTNAKNEDAFDYDAEKAVLRAKIRAYLDIALKPAADNSDPKLPYNYFAYRLRVEPHQVVMPATLVAGMKNYTFRKAGSADVKGHSCLAFQCIDADGGESVHLIWIKPNGQGKADLGNDAEGNPHKGKRWYQRHPLDPSESNGRVVPFGSSDAAIVVVCEGIETGAALAMALSEKVTGGEICVAAAINTAGMMRFKPFPGTERVIVAADRDASGAGEEAARALCARLGNEIEKMIALPGKPGEDVDWLDIFLRPECGREYVKRHVLMAEVYAPTVEEIAKAERDRLRRERAAQIAADESDAELCVDADPEIGEGQIERVLECLREERGTSATHREWVFSRVRKLVEICRMHGLDEETVQARLLDTEILSLGARPWTRSDLAALWRDAEMRTGTGPEVWAEEKAYRASQAERQREEMQAWASELSAKFVKSGQGGPAGAGAETERDTGETNAEAEAGGKGGADEETGAERESGLDRVKRLYPLPALDDMVLAYAWAESSGRFKVYKRIPGKEGKEPRHAPVMTPLGVQARLRFLDRGGAYGLRIAVEGMRGETVLLDILKSELAKSGGSEVMERLWNAGLCVDGGGEQIVMRLLKAVPPATEILVVTKPGWHDIEGYSNPIFVSPSGRIFGADGGPLVELAQGARIPEAVATGGTLEGWKAAVAAAVNVEGCPHWLLGLMAGFVGPLISLLKHDSCGINLSGLSSGGKTTAQKLAVSAWSLPQAKAGSLFQSAKSTVNGTELSAAKATGTVFTLDELAHMAGTEVGKVVYTVAGGVGKTRMTPGAEARESYSWHTFLIMSAEGTLEEKVRGDGGVWTPGQVVRVIDIDTTGVNRQVPQATLDAIGGINVNYGHAGPAFVAGLVANGLHRDPSRLERMIADHADRLAPAGSDSMLRRAAKPLAYLQTAGELARSYGLFPLNADIAGAVQWGWERFRTSSGAGTLEPEEQMLSNLREWYAKKKDVSVHCLDPDDDTPQRPFRDAEGWYNESAVYIPLSNLVAAAGGPYTQKAILNALDKRDYLHTRKDRSVKWVDKIPSRGAGKKDAAVKAVAITQAFFGRVHEDHAERMAGF